MKIRYDKPNDRGVRNTNTLDASSPRASVTVRHRVYSYKKSRRERSYLLLCRGAFISAAVAFFPLQCGYSKYLYLSDMFMRNKYVWRARQGGRVANRRMGKDVGGGE